MPLHLKNTFHNIFGVTIDQVIDDPQAKLKARQEWAYQCQLNKFCEEKAEIQRQKDWAWWEKFSQSSVRLFKKAGDSFPFKISWLGSMNTWK